MNLSAVDLNLLVVFEALVETGNVTLAGQRLGRAQPSISNALGRLRLIFGDELFVRTARSMVPTPRAIALMPVVSEALDQVRKALAQGRDFDPATSSGRRFTIAANDLADVVFVPRIASILRRVGPELSVRITTLNRTRIYTQLDDGVVDLAVGGHLNPPKRMLSEQLYVERYVCLSDAENPALKGREMTLPMYLAAPHALMVPSDDNTFRGVIDGRLTQIGLKRRVALSVSHISALPHCVARTDLVATLASRAAVQLARVEGLAVHSLPAELGPDRFSIDMVWSKRAAGDAAITWLRAQVMAAAAEMDVEVP